MGAINLWNKVSGFLLSPVVGAMASPIGVIGTYVNLANIADKNPNALALGVRQTDS